MFPSARTMRFALVAMLALAVLAGLATYAFFSFVPSGNSDGAPVPIVSPASLAPATTATQAVATATQITRSHEPFSVRLQADAWCADQKYQKGDFEHSNWNSDTCKSDRLIETVSSWLLDQGIIPQNGSVSCLAGVVSTSSAHNFYPFNAEFARKWDKHVMYFYVSSYDSASSATILSPIAGAFNYAAFSQGRSRANEGMNACRPESTQSGKDYLP